MFKAEARSRKTDKVLGEDANPMAAEELTDFEPPSV